MSCELSLYQIICMECQALFSEIRNQSNILKYHLQWAKSCIKVDSGISCKLSPIDTICMKCQKSIFWEKKR